MPQLLLELFCEEIPARMQANAAAHLKKAVTDALVARGLLYEAATSYVTPRRLALNIHGLPLASKETVEEKKGPRIDAPEAALQGFLKSSRLSALSEAEVVNDPKKGSFYVAKLTKKGEATTSVVSQIMPEIIKNFPWPKSMRWGAASSQAGALKWVRPLQSMLCTLKNEHEEAQTIVFEIGGLTSSNTTQGHRFHSNGDIIVKDFEEYKAKLKNAKVILDENERAQTLLHEARTLCFAQGLELVEDDALAREVAGLVEWPVVLMGSFEESFLNIPPEVIQTTIRANQKCFVVKNNNKLTNRFIITSNLEASDGGAAIIAGNERVIRARLSDAKFFFETDKAKPLASRLEKFKTITYHEKIGTQYARIERIQQLALEINAKTFNLDNALVRQAATLCKADLVTEMVGEFPELQGLMGRYYAEHEGLNTQVSQAIEQHYKPVGANDTLPEEPLSRIIALADKLDQLIQFWTINEKPTGSKDPFALRRAALGIIRILQETGSSLDIAPLIPEGIRNDLMGFFKDRLKQQLIDNGQRHDVVEAVFALPLTLHELTKRVEALKNFITTQEGAKFINNFNRANNILKAEEKKGAIAFLAHIQEQDCTRNEEKDVLMNLNSLTQIYNNSGNNKLQFFTDAGLINESLEAFFTNLLVNSDDPKERIVRLSLLNEFRKLCLQLGDLSKIL